METDEIWGLLSWLLNSINYRLSKIPWFLFSHQTYFQPYPSHFYFCLASCFLWAVNMLNCGQITLRDIQGISFVSWWDMSTRLMVIFLDGFVSEVAKHSEDQARCALVRLLLAGSLHSGGSEHLQKTSELLGFYLNLKSKLWTFYGFAHHKCMCLLPWYYSLRSPPDSLSLE